MATGRTVLKHTRVYIGGYDLSGYTRKIGPLKWEFDAADLTVVTDAVKGYLPAMPSVSPGTLNGVFDNTASTGLHVLQQPGAGAKQLVTVALGIRAAPAEGDPCFSGEFYQGAYQAQNEGGAVIATLPFTGWAANATSLVYSKPWGVILNANVARTAVNAAVGVDDFGASPPTLGGYMVYHITAGNGTATLKVQDAATNTDPSFGDLSGATTGSIAMAAGVSGIVALGATATVRRYLRWQLVFGTATTVTFVLAFVRRTQVQ